MPIPASFYREHLLQKSSNPGEILGELISTYQLRCGEDRLPQVAYEVDRIFLIDLISEICPEVSFSTLVELYRWVTQNNPVLNNSSSLVLVLNIFLDMFDYEDPELITGADDRELFFIARWLYQNLHIARKKHATLEAILEMICWEITPSMKKQILIKIQADHNLNRRFLSAISGFPSAGSV